MGLMCRNLWGSLSGRKDLKRRKIFQAEESVDGRKIFDRKIPEKKPSSFLFFGLNLPQSMNAARPGEFTEA